tara:strand:- start:27036 stop:27485 length:450 start_codon:yes stop_codon:yes gene_type:complete
MKVEYRVRPVTRYVVTRFEESDDGRTGGCDTRGEFDNERVAHEVAYSLCKVEHELSGLPVGGDQFVYPEPLKVAAGDGGLRIFPSATRLAPEAEARTCGLTVDQVDKLRAAYEQSTGDKSLFKADGDPDDRFRSIQKLKLWARRNARLA